MPAEVQRRRLRRRLPRAVPRPPRLRRGQRRQRSGRGPPGRRRRHQIAEIDIANTGGWQSWETVPINRTGGATGVHDVYLVFNGSTSDFVNVHWFTFQ
ncbi:carbohydrate-binding protein [Streptomyces sp. NPDC048527]|uniref:carbohydrate-binding protein n=1 Tax=Streptomyces sp. NPDC048527 TaxID=3365568 RepID=UPI00371339EE